MGGLEAIGQTGMAIYVERSSNQAEAAAEDIPPAEDLQFQLLHTQIRTVQSVSAAASQTTPPFPKRRCGRGSESDECEETPVLPALMMPRSLVQTTFSSLFSAIASRGRGRGVSFPRPFTRPVETTTTKTSLTEGQGDCAVHRVPSDIDGDDGGVSR